MKESPLTSVPVHRPAHTNRPDYDTSDNVYCQLSGVKEFWLLPPATASSCYLYPTAHPVRPVPQLYFQPIEFTRFLEKLPVQSQRIQGYFRSARGLHNARSHAEFRASDGTPVTTTC
eukprot:SAG11_NODE_2678_length_3105_cov_2.120758_3_plen_117_part_00